MADISKIRVDEVDYDIKDAIARGLIGDLSTLSTTEKADLVAALNEIAAQIAGLGGITYVESTDTSNLVSIRDLESGTYVFYGKFKPYAGSTATLTFSSKLLVNVVKQSSASQVMVFYPVNNCVQYLKVTDDTYERKNVYLNDLMDDVAALETAVGDVTTLATTETTSLVEAINELAAKIDGPTAEEVAAALPQTTALDFTNWDSGSFTETLSDGSQVAYAVTFDESGNPASIGGIAITGVA